ncbi:MAG: hypothetical protein WCE85_45435 [Paraburkholderia sp.]
MMPQPFETHQPFQPYFVKGDRRSPSIDDFTDDDAEPPTGLTHSDVPTDSTDWQVATATCLPLQYLVVATTRASSLLRKKI